MANICSYSTSVSLSTYVVPGLQMCKLLYVRLFSANTKLDYSVNSLSMEQREISAISQGPRYYNEWRSVRKGVQSMWLPP